MADDVEAEETLCVFVDWLVVRLRVLSRSRSCSPMTSLSLRLSTGGLYALDFGGELVLVARTLEETEVEGCCSVARGRCDDCEEPSTTTDEASALRRRRNAEGLTFSLSKQTISLSDPSLAGLVGACGKFDGACGAGASLVDDGFREVARDKEDVRLNDADDGGIFATVDGVGLGYRSLVTASMTAAGHKLHFAQIKVSYVLSVSG